MTGRGNNTYLLIGGPRRCRRSSMPASAIRGISRSSIASWPIAQARLDARARHPRRTRDHAVGAPAIAARASRRARSRSFRGPEEDGRTGVDWQPLDDGETIDGGRRDADRAAHARTLARSHRASGTSRRARRSPAISSILGGSVMIHVEPRRQLGAVPRVARAAARARAAAPASRRTARRSTIRTRCCTATSTHRRMRERQVIAALAARPRHRAGDRRIHL